jgi:hypothetical protein
VPEPVLEREDVDAALAALIDLRRELETIRILLEEVFGDGQEEES